MVGRSPGGRPLKRRKLRCASAGPSCSAYPAWRSTTSPERKLPGCRTSTQLRLARSCPRSSSYPPLLVAPTKVAENYAGKSRRVNSSPSRMMVGLLVWIAFGEVGDDAASGVPLDEGLGECWTLDVQTHRLAVLAGRARHAVERTVGCRCRRRARDD